MNDALEHIENDFCSEQSREGQIETFIPIKKKNKSQECSLKKTPSNFKERNALNLLKHISEFPDFHDSLDEWGYGSDISSTGQIQSRKSNLQLNQTDNGWRQPPQKNTLNEKSHVLEKLETEGSKHKLFGRTTQTIIPQRSKRCPNSNLNSNSKSNSNQKPSTREEGIDIINQLKKRRDYLQDSPDKSIPQDSKKLLSLTTTNAYTAFQETIPNENKINQGTDCRQRSMNQGKRQIVKMDVTVSDGESVNQEANRSQMNRQFSNLLGNQMNQTHQIKYPVKGCNLNIGQNIVSNADRSLINSLIQHKRRQRSISKRIDAQIKEGYGNFTPKAIIQGDTLAQIRCQRTYSNHKNSLNPQTLLKCRIQNYNMPSEKIENMCQSTRNLPEKQANRHQLDMHISSIHPPETHKINQKLCQEALNKAKKQFGHSSNNIDSLLLDADELYNFEGGPKMMQKPMMGETSTCETSAFNDKQKLSTSKPVFLAPCIQTNDFFEETKVKQNQKVSKSSNQLKKMLPQTINSYTVAPTPSQKLIPSKDASVHRSSEERQFSFRHLLNNNSLHQDNLNFHSCQQNKLTMDIESIQGKKRELLFKEEIQNTLKSLSKTLQSRSFTPQHRQQRQSKSKKEINVSLQPQLNSDSGKLQAMLCQEDSHPPQASSQNTINQVISKIISREQSTLVGQILRERRLNYSSEHQTSHKQHLHKTICPKQDQVKNIFQQKRQKENLNGLLNPSIKILNDSSKGIALSISGHILKNSLANQENNTKEPTNINEYLSPVAKGLKILAKNNDNQMYSSSNDENVLISQDSKVSISSSYRSSHQNPIVKFKNSKLFSNIPKVPKPIKPKTQENSLNLL